MDSYDIQVTLDAGNSVYGYTYNILTGITECVEITDIDGEDCTCDDGETRDVCEFSSIYYEE